MSVEKELRLNIQQIAHHHPFLGSIGMGITIIESTAFPTLGSDVRILYANPKLCETAPFTDPAIRRFILAHNILHNAFNHHFRMPGTLEQVDMESWIHAQDIVVNNLLLAIQAGRISQAKNPESRKKEIQFPLFRAPKKADGSLDITYEPKFAGWSAERIYVELIKGKQANKPVTLHSVASSSQTTAEKRKYEHKPVNSSSWDTSMGTHTYFKPDEAKAKETQIRQQNATINSINHVKSCGSGTGDALRTLSEEFSSEPSLEEALQEVLVSNEPGDISWSKLKRRWIPDDLYFPSEDTNKGAHIVVGVDVSGSIGAKELNEFWSILRGALHSGMKLTLDIVSCDTVITSHHKASWNEPESYDKIKDLPGGGGTDFCPVFEWQIKNQPEAQAIIFFTDLCGTFPKSCELPTFWIVDCAMRGKMDVPFGQVVYYNPLEIYIGK